ncbi:hypothetical protein SDC9_188838 [bioreactor metagenome]|uniref:Uncharacterized protein n=1 Tax=bioreactor metagenome TaxID=1076179 RepID=A0A645HQF7_9ZZZZ|nr:hypothetical protein CLBADJHJ_03492 [[Clostridium] scindens]
MRKNVHQYETKDKKYECLGGIKNVSLLMMTYFYMLIFYLTILM